MYRIDLEGGVGVWFIINGSAYGEGWSIDLWLTVGGFLSLRSGPKNSFSLRRKDLESVKGKKY